MSQERRPEINASDYFSNSQRKLAVADRRPVIRRASDLVGPGISMNAIRITDYNDLLATFNGFFSSNRAQNGPDVETTGPDEGFDTNTYSGFVSSDAELGGVQLITDLNTGTRYQRTFRRSPMDDATIYWTAWVVL